MKAKNASTPVLYKVVMDGCSVYGGDLEWSLPTDGKPGDWHAVEGDLVQCRNGLHLTNNPRRRWTAEDVLHLADFDRLSDLQTTRDVLLPWAREQVASVGKPMSHSFAFDGTEARASVCASPCRAPDGSLAYAERSATLAGCDQRASVRRAGSSTSFMAGADGTHSAQASGTHTFGGRLRAGLCDCRQTPCNRGNT